MVHCHGQGILQIALVMPQTEHFLVPEKTSSVKKQYYFLFQTGFRKFAQLK